MVGGYIKGLKKYRAEQIDIGEEKAKQNTAFS